MEEGGAEVAKEVVLPTLLIGGPLLALGTFMLWTMGKDLGPGLFRYAVTVLFVAALIFSLSLFPPRQLKAFLESLNPQEIISRAD